MSSACYKSANISSQTSEEKMSLSSFPQQYRGSNAFKLKVRRLAGIIRTLLIRAGVEKNPGPLKCHCCSKTLGRSTKKAPTIWCHVCGWVHFKCSGLNSAADYEKLPNFDVGGLKNTKFAPKNYDPALHALQRLHTTTNNPSAFGSRQSLRSAATTNRTTGKQVDKLLSLSETYTKFRASKTNFTRLKFQSYRINEIWSGDLADVHQLAKDNDGKKFLLVFVHCLGHFLRGEPIDNKSAKHTRAALEKMTRKQTPEKIGIDKRKEFIGEFAKLCLEKNITVYSTHSEQKSCFAERYIRTLKSILFKYLHENNTSKYIDQIQNFVSLINSRPNRTIKSSTKNITRHDVPYSISLSANANPIRKPRYQRGDTVRIRLKVPTFHKGYKIQFTEEVFEVVANTTLNPPTYNIKEKHGQMIQGKFYEQELVLFRYNWEDSWLLAN